MYRSRRAFLASTAALVSALPTGFFTASASAASNRWKLPAKNAVRTVEHAWMPMRDGVRLSVRLWLPQIAAERAPVVMEYIPYRKRDLYRAHDSLWGQTLAGYGIAFARVDARGSGESEGFMNDEYTDQELRDGVDAIAWLARQDWSNGSVGMRGYSWGGINTLQVAALAPPQLKAIMPMCCTDTRYTDDAHYIGGALGLTDLQWGVQFKSVMALPPDPAIVGEAWRTLWRERLGATPAIMARWLEHQRNDSYWMRGTVSVDYGTIQCPVYIVDGWVDTYVNTVSRVLTDAKVPRKALIGAWAHGYPESTRPGPSLEWAYEEVRWWQQWLGGVETGIMQEPMVRAYMPYRTSSEIYPADTPGRWIAERQWPSSSVSSRRYFLAEHVLAEQPAAARVLTYTADKVVGLCKPEWLPFPPEGMPLEQSPDDAKSMLFDSPVLESAVEILGHPVAHIRVAADAPVAKLALRLCEVLPDGSSWIVTYGLLNLTHRTSDATPEALTPGEAVDVTIRFSLIAHRFRRGSRIRLSLSESLWPLVWPSPTIVTLQIHLDASSLELPVRKPTSDPPFPIPVNPPGTARQPDRRAPLASHGPDRQGWYEINQDAPLSSYVIEDTQTTVTGIMGQKQTLKIRDGDANSCVWSGERLGGFKRGDWNVSVYSSYKLSSTAENFKLEETIRAFDGGTLIFEQVNRSTVPRDLA